MTFAEAVEVAAKLGAEEIPVAVVEWYSVKPMDFRTIRTVAENARFVLTVEDHYPEGGMGEAVAASLRADVPVHVAGVTMMPIPEKGTSSLPSRSWTRTA